MKQYTFKTKKLSGKNSLCLEQCQVKNCKIGSIVCQECDHCKAFDLTDLTWIKCEVLDKATGKERLW